MIRYILQRMALIVPTLFGILLLNFLIINMAPGGPVERTLATLSGHASDTSLRTGTGGGSEVGGSGSNYRGSQGLDPELIKKIEAMYGFDKPPTERFWQMIRNYLSFDLGDSFYRNSSVIDLILDKMPVSISLGLWSTLLVYLISIPMGIKKAIDDGSPFDLWSSAVIVVGYAVPSFLFAMFLIIFFCGGSYLDWFPLRGLTSDNFDDLSAFGKVIDYFWHITLPVLAMTIGGFATLTMLTKNSFLDEIRRQYVVTARAKGLSEKQLLRRHVFRNAMLIIIAGFPAALVGIFFTGSLLIEVIFSLDGLGLLGFEAAVNRDYPVVFGTLFVFTLISMVFKLISDLTYRLVDPRIDFSSRERV